MNNGGAVDDTAFADDVKLSFHIPVDSLPALKKDIADATAGEGEVEIIDEKYYETAE